MTPTELLRPRYKVMESYPKCPFKIGDILFYDMETTWDIFMLERNAAFFKGKYESRVDIEANPHLFKKLEWWEERELPQLPKYVKIINGYSKIKDESIREVNEWIYLLEKTVLRADIFPLFVYAINLLPSTEEEYKDYQNSKS